MEGTSDPPPFDEADLAAPDAPVALPEAFDHPDFLYEVTFDGFRGLAHVNGHHCQLVSRNGHVYKSWPYLSEEIAHAVRAHSAILDGEIACLAPDGSSRFYDLLFRREWPYFSHSTYSSSTAKISAV